MNLLRAISVTALCGVLSAGYAAAESLTVDVPFSFKLGDREMPAGDYRVTESTPNGVVSMNGERVSTMTLSVADGNAKGQPGLVFERIDGAEHLVEVDLASSGSRRIAAK